MAHGTLKPEGYIPRIVDREITERLMLFGGVEVTGTMWCGKTWTSMAHGESITRIGLQAARLAAEADPQTALIGQTPHVIDEWQDVPAIWDEVRSVIDTRAGRPGQFILTGSSQVNRSLTRHSGAGRISRLRMRTMSLAETGDSSGAVSLGGLFRGAFEPQLVQQRLAPLAEIICRGGWPALIGNRITDSSRFLDSYFDAMFGVNLPRRGLIASEARRVALSLARNTGGAVTMATLAEDADFSSPKDKAAANRVTAYLQAMDELFMLEAVRGWDAPIRSKSRLRTKPKYYFADPSLTANLLSITPERLLTDGQVFGLLFESLCLHDLAVYSSVLPGAGEEPLHYYRDSDGLEVDAIIELRDGRWAAVEIKLGENKVPEAENALIRLRDKVAANPAARNPEPCFMAVLVGAGEYARYDREKDIYIVPLTALGA